MARYLVVAAVSCTTALVAEVTWPATSGQQASSFAGFYQ